MCVCAGGGGGGGGESQYLMQQAGRRANAYNMLTQKRGFKLIDSFVFLQLFVGQFLISAHKLGITLLVTDSSLQLTII